MIPLLKLILAHFIGDFLLQPGSWIQEKQEDKIKSIRFWMHIIIHGLLVLVLLWDWNYWFLALLLMIIHGIIDLVKLYAQKVKNRPQWFIIDQVLHFISIIFLWIIWFKPDLSLMSLNNKAAWTFLTAIIFLTFVSKILIKELMSNWPEAIDIDGDDSLIDAGKWIGIIERVLVFIFVVIGQWGAVGFLLAAKSVFRFGDLNKAKDRKLTEYVLIGTFLSFGIAIITGMAVSRMVMFSH